MGSAWAPHWGVCRAGASAWPGVVASSIGLSFAFPSRACVSGALGKARGSFVSSQQGENGADPRLATHPEVAQDLRGGKCEGRKAPTVVAGSVGVSRGAGWAGGWPWSRGFKGPEPEQAWRGGGASVTGPALW